MPLPLTAKLAEYFGVDMSGTLTLHWENVLGWFETLGQQMRKAHFVKVGGASEGGGWMFTISFRGTDYQLRLYQVEVNAHYAIAFCEASNTGVVCHQAWHLRDTTRLPAEPAWMLCMQCVCSHSTDYTCRNEVSDLIWNDPAKSDAENVEFVIGHVFEIAKRRVDEHLASIA